MTQIAPQDIADWSAYAGRSETTSQHLDETVLKRFLLVLGESGATDGTVPPMAHWAYFLPMTANGDIGPDGHLKRGGFMPLVTLPRRMFAAGTTRFLNDLAIGREATCTARILDVTHKSGRSGDLVFVEVERTVSQSGTACVIERQAIVFRDAGASVPAVEQSDPAALEEPVWTPDPVDLFRFSAVTFNGHRIHYDEPYATGEEGYPGLVVHGPLTASMLCRLAARTADGVRMTEFSFRAAAPLFAGQPVRLRANADGNTVEAVALRQDGQTAVTARATFK